MKKLAVLAIALTPAVSMAHPGHGTTAPSSWAHYLTEPLHVLVLLAAVAGVAELVHLGRRRARR